MIKASKFLATSACVLAGIFNYANASDISTLTKAEDVQTVATPDVRLLDLNVFAWAIFNYPTFSTSARTITSYINDNKFDFITTQEFQGGATWDNHGGPWGYLTNHGGKVWYDPVRKTNVTEADYQLDPKYKMVVAPADPILYYDSSKWSFSDYRSINMVPDTGGPRTAVFATFTKTDGSGKSIVVATTHLCIAYSGHYCLGNDPQNREYSAHVQDAQTLAQYIKTNYPSNMPVILTGDFNSMTNSYNQSIDIKNKLSAANMVPVIDNNTKTFIGPTFGGVTIDFVYSNNLNVIDSSLYSGSASDHKGISVDFNFGSTPPPIPCNAPTSADVSATFTANAPNAGTVHIVANSSYASTTGMEIWNWNQTQKMEDSVGKHIEKSDNVSGYPKYTYSVRNVCQGNTSAFYKFDVPAQ